jgi:hypothetical protein
VGLLLAGKPDGAARASLVIWRCFRLFLLKPNLQLSAASLLSKFYQLHSILFCQSYSQ